MFIHHDGSGRLVMGMRASITARKQYRSSSSEHQTHTKKKDRERKTEVVILHTEKNKLDAGLFQLLILALFPPAPAISPVMAPRELVGQRQRGCGIDWR
jgi:hypothetical protein